MGKFPEVGEFVLGTVKSVNPNSAFIQLENYDAEGMVHISEISKSWVRDIRRHVKKGQLVVVKVLNVNPSKGHVSLSLKRVSPSQKREVLRSYKLKKRSKNFLSFLKKDLKMSDGDVEKKVAQPLKSEFGSVYAGFEAALIQPDKLKEAIPDYVKAVTKIAEKNIEIKEFTMKLPLILKSNAGDGVNQIKKALESTDLNVSYISAPKYVLCMETKDPKEGEKKLRKEAEKIIDKLNSLGGKGSIEE